jgi:hypothetical protein
MYIVADPIPFTLLLSGPIKSRFTNKLTEESLIDSLLLIKNINPLNQIVVSTYKGEFPRKLEIYVDNVILNDDPGPDFYRVDPWPIGKRDSLQSSNISRMLGSSVAGLSQVNTSITIKTRLELLPQNSEKFLSWYNKYSAEIRDSDEPLIAFLLEHFSGISFSINGLIGMIPDTFQMSKTQTLKEFWSESSLFWNEHSHFLTNSKIRFPITPEQVIGLNYLGLYSSFDIASKIPLLRRHYISFDLIKSQIRAEKELYRWILYKDAGLSVNYFAGTLAINTSRKVLLHSNTRILRNLSTLILKKVYHHYRRYIQGVRRAIDGR